MTRFFLPLFLAVSIILLSDTVSADDNEPPLFVVSSGQDKGNCQDAGSPCRSLAYALQRVGKHGQIRVGDGSFELTESADIIYLLSGAIDVRGSDLPGSRSTLTGVPPEFAGVLQAKGFNVITDSKGLHKAAVQTQASLKTNTAATACAGGFAGVFPCNSVDLLSHIADRTPAGRGADIWGFMDLNTHREYVIIAYSTGTAVFDVTDPENPLEIGFVNGQTTTWRDVKIYQFWNATQERWNAHAYVTADNASDGLVIIELSDLPQQISRVSYNSDFLAAHNIFLTGVDYSTGLALGASIAPNLVLAGSNLSDGRFRSYSLANPSAPSFIAAPATPGDQPGGDRLYMHDAASMVVTGARKDSQCINAGNSDHCDVLFDFNESSLDIWDVTVPANPVRLSRMPYSNSRYTHSGWPSEDQQFLFIQDELDERDNGLQTTLRVVSIADLQAPGVVGTWTGPTSAIDHNGFVRGNRYYMSNYTRGLTVLDISNPASPVAVGRFDTYPSSDTTGFPGNWGVYPYLPSGNIALSDIDSGLYMVADNTRDIARGQIGFAAASFAADETQPLELTVQRSGGSQGAVSVAWELLEANGSAADVTNHSGELTWPDGDSSSRTISLAPVDDGSAEGMEQLLVKLMSPGGGAALAAQSISSVYLSDPGDTSEVAFTSDSINIPERSFATAIAVVRRNGSGVGPVTVEYSIAAGDATGGSDYTGPAAGTLTWEDGDATPKWIEYAIVDDGSGESDEFFDIALSNVSAGTIGANAAMRVTIVDGSGFNSAPNAVAGASQTVAIGATVTLNGTASNDPDGDQLMYAWSQTTGPSVTLTNANSAIATFAAPSVSSDTLLRFELAVSDNGGLLDTSTTNVTVTTGTTNSSGGGGGTFSIFFLLSLAGLRLITRRDAT